MEGGKIWWSLILGRRRRGRGEKEGKEGERERGETMHRRIAAHVSDHPSLSVHCLVLTRANYFFSRLSVLAVYVSTCQSMRVCGVALGMCKQLLVQDPERVVLSCVLVMSVYPARVFFFP